MPSELEQALAAGQQAWQSWQSQTARPREVQQKLLLDLLWKNRDTAFGREHGLASIKSLDDYRKQVPIGDYERFRPYIDRAAHGEATMLTREPVLMFTMTSGSTGQPKLIPVTDSTRTAHAKLTQLWYGRAFAAHPQCLQGRVFGLVGAAEEGRTPGGIPYGAASGLIYRSSPAWIKQAHALPYEIAEIEDFEAKYYAAMRLGLAQNVTFLGTPNPSTILRLAETADRFKQEIVRDMRDGTISGRFEIGDNLRRALGARLAPNPGRAQELETLIASRDALRPLDYWPNLKLIGCWKGGSVGVRLKEFAPWFGADIPIRDLGYMASEGQMSLPIGDNGAAGILAVDTNFYEFIPEAEIGRTAPVTLTCDELDAGSDYYLILTTAGGLYRYDINDLVRVTGFYGQTPLIEFLRKGRDVTNITGEKLHVNQVIDAMAQASRGCGVAVHHFTVCADVEHSHYVIAVETDAQDQSTLTTLLNELDKMLGKLNVEYAQKRRSQRLRPPVLWLMKPGWFERKTSVAMRRNVRDTQFKAQLLTTTLEPQHEVLRVAELPRSPA